MAIIFGILGLVIVSVAIWLKNEKRQDILFILGGISLFAYSVSIKDPIFSILQVVFIVSVSAELVKLSKLQAKNKKT